MRQVRSGGTVRPVPPGTQRAALLLP